MPPAGVCSATTPMSFATLAKAADPGVVTILSKVERVYRSGRKSVLMEGLGSGFIYDKGGYVLTNNHVVEGATAIQVKFEDGHSVSAKQVGADKHTDVAVLKCELPANTTTLSLGDSDAIEVGDWVVAIGNPFGLSHTVSAGILSAKGRTRQDVQGLDPSGYFNFLQTTAPINQGNSGGPLLNLKGEVVGINTAIRANANNIGFAIPINMVKQLLPILVRDGKIARSALGVSVRGIDQIEAERLGRPDHQGAWVVDVKPGSGADRAGIAPDDVIVAFDGKPIRDPNELRWLASIAGVGKTVNVRIARGTRNFEVRVTLAALPEQPEEEEAPTLPGMPPGHP
ncbi:MAG: trypsin-like peptidase domain-containing protein [Deltaproteobacteria bacterium]|nr:trypsin-like peptidase domain-containing protein [Deltaproteobacteria bacterium]